MTDSSESAARARDSAIFEVSDRYIEDCAALDPMLASFWGISGYDHQITDYSPDGWAARLDLQRAALRRLDDVTPTAPGDRIAIDVMRDRLDAHRRSPHRPRRDRRAAIRAPRSRRQGSAR